MIKQCELLLVLVCVIFLRQLAPAQDAGNGQLKIPEFVGPVKIMAGGKPIYADGGHAAPAVYDFDRDGKRDLIVGQMGQNGVSLVYLNIGTDEAPKFDTFTILQAGGADAAILNPG